MFSHLIKPGSIAGSGACDVLLAATTIPLEIMPGVGQKVTDM
ncbi:MAG: hypothetical protein RIC18_03070 [Hoeflea sp.]